MVNNAFLDDFRTERLFGSVECMHAGVVRRQRIGVAQVSPYGSVSEQSDIFQKDIKDGAQNFINYVKDEFEYLVKIIATLAIVPFAFFIDCYRVCVKKITITTCLKNIYKVPLEVIRQLFSAILWPFSFVQDTVEGLSKGAGLLLWHSGEWIVRKVRTVLNIPNPIGSYTLLSDRKDIRDIVYKSLGITLLAGIALCIPILPVQLVALPILLGSLYGSIDNQFTIRTCPEYYTMGHYYDGKEFKGHAVKTNSLWIKPIITGCYATTMVTKIAGVVLAIAGVVPFTAAVLPVTIAAAGIGIVLVTSLVAGHIFARMKETKIQSSIEQYAKLCGIEKLSEEQKDMTWDNFFREHGLMGRGNSDERLRLTKYITGEVLMNDLPIRYIAGWASNNARNSVGYLSAGVGTVALSIAAVALRILCL